MNTTSVAISVIKSNQNPQLIIYLCVKHTKMEVFYQTSSAQTS